MLSLRSSQCDPKQSYARTRVVASAIRVRSYNQSFAKILALSFQVCDPHNRDYIAVVMRLFFCFLVAGPDKIRLTRKGLSLLLKPKLSFADMADHGIHHGGPMVFDPGCIMMSRIETVLKPGIRDGVSPSYSRTTTPGQGVVSL